MADKNLLPNQPLGQKLIKKGFRLYFFMFLIAPVGYIIRVIVSNELSVADIGIFYSILGFVILISMYNDLGLTETLQYYLPKYWIEKKYNHYKTIFYFTLFIQLISGILIAGIIYLSSNRLAIHHFHSIESVNIIKILCIYFIGINFIQVFSSVYTAFQDTFSLSLIETIRMYVTLLFTVIFWLTNALTNVTFSIAWICGTLACLLVSFIIFFKKYGYTLQKGTLEIKNDMLKVQLKYAFWIFLAGNVSSLFGQITQQMVIGILGPQSAGFYANLLSLIGVFSMITGPILGLMFPIVTELISKNDIGKLHVLQNVIYKYFSVFALIVSGFFLVFGKEISAVLFGVKFIQSGVLFSYVSPFLLFNILFNINFGILAGLGMVKERVKVLFIGLLLTIFLNIILMYVFGLGLVGATISLLIGWIVLRWFSVIKVNENKKIEFDWYFFICNLIVIGLLCILLYFIKDYYIILEDKSRLSNALYLLISGIIYCCILAMLNYKSLRLLLSEINRFKKSTGEEDLVL